MAPLYGAAMFAAATRDGKAFGTAARWYPAECQYLPGWCGQIFGTVTAILRTRLTTRAISKILTLHRGMAFGNGYKVLRTGRIHRGI
jgi:hypothetical protein